MSCLGSARTNLGLIFFNEPCSPLTLKRFKKDVLAIFKDPLPGIMILPYNDDISKIHALINGPAGTPYEGGFFHFFIACATDYPIKPPRVKIVTTGRNTVHFNPNLYSNGFVCLSILGTAPGNRWSPVMDLSTLLISIQSILNEKPYHNMPTFEKERNPGDAERYNQMIRHESIRVSVCNLLEKTEPCPDEFFKFVCSSFLNNYEFYTNICKSNMHLDGQTMLDPFYPTNRTFCYEHILGRLEKLKSTISSLENDKPADDDDDDDSIYETDDDDDTKEDSNAAKLKDISSSTVHDPAGRF